MLLYFFSFMLALFLGLYITPIVQEAAFKYDIVDYPDGQLKKHGKPVAYLGGIALYLAFLFTLALSFEFSQEVLGLLLSGTIVILLGIIDDLKFLSPGLKLVGQAIAIFKDTSLVFIIGLTEILAIAQRVVPGQPEFVGSQRENLLFVAFVYWMFTFTFSRASQRLERKLGVGER